MIVTEHAAIRMSQRNLDYRAIVMTLKHGHQKPGTNKRCYRQYTVAAVRDGNTYTVRTVWVS